MTQAAEATFPPWVLERPAFPALPHPRIGPGPAAATLLHGAVALALFAWSPDVEPPAAPTMIVEMVEFAAEPAPTIALPEPTIAEPPPLTSAEVPPPEPEPEAEVVEAAPEPAPAPKPKPKPAEKPRPKAPAPSQAAVLTASAPSEAAPAIATAPPAFVPPSSDAAYLQNPKPRYPRAARMRGMEGVVLLAVQVGRDGSTSAVTVKASSGFPLLDEAAVEAVRSWRFVPAMRGGQPEPGEVEVPIRFNLAG